MTLGSIAAADRTAEMRVRPDDPAYREQARREAAYWERPLFTTEDLDVDHTAAVRAFVNRDYTGDPAVSWLDAIVARGPFARAAVLGCTGGYEQAWAQRRASQTLDVYDLSPGVLRQARRRLGARRLGLSWASRHVRFRCADLNFVRLPAAHYDVVWSSGSVHHVTNLEYLFAEIACSLRPGGVFALHDYIGETRLQYAPARLQAVNAAFERVPLRFHRDGITTIAPSGLDEISPFEAMRSDEILDLARAQFEVERVGLTYALFPLLIFLDLRAIEREAPEIFDQLFAAEAQARRDGFECCSMFGVFRKK